MDKEDRPICFKLSIKPVEGKVDKKTRNLILTIFYQIKVRRKVIGSTIVVIGCDFIEDEIDEEIE